MAGCEPLRRLAEEARVLLVYGPAASGKTTLALTMLAWLCLGRCLYVTTERLDFLRRAEQLRAPLDRIDVYEALDHYDLLDLALEPRIASYDVVVVDSVNAFIGTGEDAYRITLLVAAALRNLAERLGVRVIETAQVRARPGEEAEEPAAGKALELWADTVIELRRGEAGERIAQPRGGRPVAFRITGEGVEWLRC